MNAPDYPVRVVFCADEVYAMPLAVAVRSLLDNAVTPVEVAVIGRGLTTGTTDRLYRSWDSDAPVRFVELAESYLEGLSGWGYVSSTMYGRLLIPNLVPLSWTRVIYLDADVVICADLATLFQYDLDGQPIGATPDPLFAQWWLKHRPQTEHTAASSIFSSGLMVMDLSRWRAEDLSGTLLATARRLPEELQSDQAALNVVIGNRWARLDHSWNVTTNMYFRGQRDKYATVVANMRIRHFAPFKPWQPRYHAMPDAKLFRRYLALTDFGSDGSR